MKSCFTCRFARTLPNGTFCGRYPPTLEVLRDERTVRLMSWMPPVPIEPCGEYHYRLWRRRDVKRTSLSNPPPK